MHKKSTFLKFAAYYKPYKFLFFFDLFCALLVSAVDLVFPQVIRYLTRIIPKIRSGEVLLFSDKTLFGFDVGASAIIYLGLIIAIILLGLYIILLNIL